MADDFPLMPVPSGGPTAPLETPMTGASAHPQPHDGGFADVVSTDYRQSPVVTSIFKGIGNLQYGNQAVPADKAKQIVTNMGLDPAFIPKAGIGYGALLQEVNRQTEVRLHQVRMERSGGPTWYSSLGGGAAAMVADPSSVVLGPLSGTIAKLAAGGIVRRALVGGAEAGAYQFGMEAGQSHVTGHDEDINSWQMLHDTTYGAIAGAAFGGAFGPRALPARDVSSHLSMIEYAENSAGYAKAHGISPDDVVSPKGAVSRYQITEATARTYGLDYGKLRSDPVYAKAGAEKILRDLDRRFNSDPEAIAVGYNAGPGWAKKFLASGKDRSILPKETQGYLKRIDAMGIEPRPSFGQRTVQPDEVWLKELANRPEEHQGEMQFESQLPLPLRSHVMAEAEEAARTGSALSPDTQAELGLGEHLPSQRELDYGPAARFLRSDELTQPVGIPAPPPPRLAGPISHIGPLRRYLTRARIALSQVPEGIVPPAMQGEIPFEGTLPGRQLDLDLADRARRLHDIYAHTKQGEFGMEKAERQLHLSLQQFASDARPGVAHVDHPPDAPPQLFPTPSDYLRSKGTPEPVVNGADSVLHPPPQATEAESNALIEARSQVAPQRQEAFDTAIKAAGDMPFIGSLKPDEFGKAVEAAARCALRKGVDLAD